MRKWITAISTGLALTISSQASAAALCTGNAQYVYIYSNGAVMVNGTWRNHLTQICNVKEEWKGVSPEVCFTWFSAVSSANTENQQVSLYYSHLSNASECANLLTYGAVPAPVYVLLRE